MTVGPGILGVLMCHIFFFNLERGGHTRVGKCFMVIATDILTLDLIENCVTLKLIKLFSYLGCSVGPNPAFQIVICRLEYKIIETAVTMSTERENQSSFLCLISRTLRFDLLLFYSILLFAVEFFFSQFLHLT